MTSTGSGNPPQARRFSGLTLRRSIEQVSDSWFPPNEALLEKIKQGLTTGYYDQDLDLLLKDITQDLSLFCYCLRELGDMVEGSASFQQAGSPTSILRQAGLETLKQILNKDAKQISPHSLQTISEAQMTCFQDTMVSVAASQRLATHYKLDPELAFSAALIRQLGYTLLAWSYPAEYEKALTMTTTELSLDIVLTQLFGFSPSLLAIKVARHWNLLPEVYRASESSEINDSGDRSVQEVEQVADTLVRICKVGEALSRANNPRTYPTAISDWEFARVEIEKALGVQGMKMIAEQLADQCERYVELMPHIFKDAFRLDPITKIAAHQNNNNHDTLSLVTQCRPFLRKKLEHLYSLLRPDAVTRDTIHLLSREIIPSSGFVRGVVYTLDPMSMMLIPQLVVANANLREFEPVEYSPHSSRGQFVAEAFQNTQPMTKAFLSNEGVRSVAFAGGLGVETKMAVLYLEMNESLYQGDQAQQIVHFRAIMQAFSDCLNIK